VVVVVVLVVAVVVVVLGQVAVDGWQVSCTVLTAVWACVVAVRTAARTVHFPACFPRVCTLTVVPWPHCTPVPEGEISSLPTGPQGPDAWKVRFANDPGTHVPSGSFTQRLRLNVQMLPLAGF